MKKSIVPLEYKYDISKIFVGLIFVGISALVLMLPAVINIVNLEDKTIIQIILNKLLGMVGIFFIIRGIIINLKIGKKKIWRKNMLKNSFVKGNIEEIENIVIRKYNKSPGAERYADNIVIYYSLVVSYVEPQSRERKVIKSAPYYEMIEYYLKDSEVKVYIDENSQETLIDGLNLRTSSKDPSIYLADKDSIKYRKIGFYITRYEKIICVIATIVVIAIIIFRIIKKSG